MTYVYNSPDTYFLAVPKSITLIFDYGSVDANIIFDGFISLKLIKLSYRCIILF